MITFDSLTLKAFVDENGEFLTDSHIQKIQQPTRREVILSLRKNSKTRKLYININPQEYHVCFMSKENEEKRLIKIPQNPPMFCMLLRKYIENARIVKVCQPEYERILELYTETYNELGEKIYLCIAVELMGKHSNIVLYNHDTNVILGCAHNVGAEKSREREMAGGLPYVYPVRKNSWFKCENSLANDLQNINDRIDEYYANLIASDKFNKQKQSILLNINRQLKRNKNSLEKINASRKKDFEIYRHKGDLIMSNLYGNSDFQKNIEVFDYISNKNITIELDETKTLKENANRFYKLYNKYKTADAKQAELSDELQNTIKYLMEQLYFVENANDINDLPQVEGSHSEPKKNIVTEIKSDNYTIFVGKNSKQNDYIVSKLARNDDLWFHTKDCPGSHVLLRAENKTDELILQCAKIAKENSSGANSSKVKVIYTFAKHLKKPPKANLGYVTYSHEKEIVID